jgi:hypothetical protein
VICFDTNSLIGGPVAGSPEAARLFNAVNRKRGLRVDAMIAGTATASRANLATNNHDDFGPFVPHGLELVWARGLGLGMIRASGVANLAGVSDGFAE